MRFFLIFFLSCVILLAQDKKSFSLKDLIQIALENNLELKKVRYDLMTSDANYLKSQSKYETNLKSDSSFLTSTIKPADDNSNRLDKKSQDSLSGGLSKVYKTGTTAGITASTNRKDDNKGENTSFIDVNASPPIFTGDLKLELSQELLKNSFGIQDKNTDSVSKNRIELTNLQLRQTAAGIISRIIIDYWNYVVKEESITTYQELYDNTVRISRLIRSKQSVGLSKNYENNQWRSLLQQARNKVSKAKIDSNSQKRKIARELNLKDRELSLKVEMFTSKFKLPNLEDDLEEAYNNRRDYQILKIQNTNFKLLEENAKQDLLPSVKITTAISSKYQNYKSHSDNFLKPSNIASLKYKEMQAGVTFLKPISSIGKQAAVEEYQIASKKNHVEQEDLKAKIYNEILDRRETIGVNYKIFNNSKKALDYSKKYYDGLLLSYNKGTINSLVVKNALDSVILNDLSLTQAKIQYSISIIQYYLTKNTLLQYFDIDDKL